jgi:hypothetical protein
MNYNILTVRDGQAYGSRHGLGRPQQQAHKSRANQSRGFFVHNGKSYGRSVWESARIAGPVAGLPTRTESPTFLAGGVRLSQPQQQDTTMSHDTAQGASVATTPVRFVSRDTVIRRIRRFHARNGYTFHIASNQAEFEAVGDWSIRDRNGDIAFRRIANFESYARSNGSLKPDEMMVGQTMFRMFDAVGQLIGVQDSRFRAEAVVKAINGSMVEFVVEIPAEADDSQEAGNE